MKEVDELIYQRMIGDTGLVALLNSQASRIGYGFQLNADNNSPQLRFHQVLGQRGSVTGHRSTTWEYIYEFGIWSNQYVDIISRLKRLFDGHCFSVTGTNEIGSVSAIFETDGPDQYDEGLEVNRKDLRFRFFVVQKAQNPI